MAMLHSQFPEVLGCARLLLPPWHLGGTWKPALSQLAWQVAACL